MMPEGWSEEILGNICDIAIGGTPSRDKEEYWARHDGGNVWVSIADLNGKAWVSDSKEKITQRGVEKSNVKLVTPGTVLMSFKLTIGRVARAAISLYTNEAIAAFVPKRSLVCDNFLFHVLPSAAEGGCADVAVKGKTLNKEKLKNLQLLLPPLPEQRAIAEILDSVDATISATEATLAQTRRVKQALLQQLLTKGIDENGRPHTKFKMTEIGEIPEAWEADSLKNLVELEQGIQIPVEEQSTQPEGETIRFLRISDYTKADETPRFIKRSDRLNLVSEDDVVMVRYGEAGRVVRGFAGAIANNLFSIRAINPAKLLKEFLFHFAGSSLFQDKIAALNGSTTMPQISHKSLYLLQMPLPSASEQLRISRAVSIIDSSVSSICAELEHHKNLKRALMRDLLTGKVRVKDVKL